MHRRWSVLVGAPGFSGRELWYGFISADGDMAPVLPTIADLPRTPDPVLLDKLMYVCRQVLDECGFDDGSVAILLARPGSGRVEANDADWARGLLDAARRAEIRMQPIHLASDHDVRVIAPDDLVGPTGGVR